MLDVLAIDRIVCQHKGGRIKHGTWVKILHSEYTKEQDIQQSNPLAFFFSFFFFYDKLNFCDHPACCGAGLRGSLSYVDMEAGFGGGGQLGGCSLPWPVAHKVGEFLWVKLGVPSNTCICWVCGDCRSCKLLSLFVFLMASVHLMKFCWMWAFGDGPWHDGPVLWR